MVRINSMFPDPATGVKVTNPRAEPLRGTAQAAPAGGANAPLRTGPRRTASGTFKVISGNDSINIAVANNNRKLLIIQNQDPAQKLFFNFGAPANASSGFIPALGNLFLDYACPSDSVWVFALVDLTGYFMEVAPIG